MENRSVERKFRSKRRPRKRSRSKQLAGAQALKLASFYEARASVVEAVESNAAAVQVEEVAEEVAEERTSNNDDEGLGLPDENEPAAKKSRSELKINMKYFQQPGKDDDRFSGTTEEDNFIINFGICKKSCQTHN